jgi:hypothetical protein
MNIKYKLKKIYPGIYLCTIKDQYDLSMTFCRVQEFYESPYKEIRGKYFKLLDLMDTYVKRRKEHVFLYPEHWCGFNIPGNVIKDLYYNDEHQIVDINEYDLAVMDMNDTIEEKTHKPYYLIASGEDELSTVYHEVCHGLYSLDKDYKKKTDKLISKIIPTAYKKISKVLLELGYCKAVIKDEVQAYLTTGMNMFYSDAKFNKKELCNVTDVATLLKANFKDYKKQIEV